MEKVEIYLLYLRCFSYILGRHIVLIFQSILSSCFRISSFLLHVQNNTLPILLYVTSCFNFYALASSSNFEASSSHRIPHFCARRGR
ncbi:hypothetical protein BDZ89DRAFT_330211 [Hymenopellis radicata]|nr:hypothetical protein BDZ89DRAFT_330211 [Hymenopellis radicata]